MARRPAQEPEVLASKATWRDTAVFAKKLVYSAIFLGIAAGILHIFYPDVTGRISRWTGLFLALALGPRFISGSLETPFSYPCRQEE